MKLRVAVDAKHGWALLATLVVAWDVLAPETLSDGFARAHPNVKFVASAIVLGHLFDIIPEWADPIHGIGKLLGVTARVRVTAA